MATYFRVSASSAFVVLGFSSVNELEPRFFRGYRTTCYTYKHNRSRVVRWTWREEITVGVGHRMISGCRTTRRLARYRVQDRERKRGRWRVIALYLTATFGALDRGDSRSGRLGHNRKFMPGSTMVK